MRIFRPASRIATLFLVAASWSGCTHKKTLWIYTSLYKEVIAEMEPKLKAALPGVEVRWFQGGSENVAARINTELFAGRTQADLILTSDPFWYLELKKAGKLLPYDSPAAKEVPAQYVDPDHAFVSARLPVMVIAYNPEALAAAEAPRSFKDLASPRFKDKISMGNPLESGTSFTAVALLAQAYGWDYFKALRKLDFVAAGGNSSVISRIETQERPVGIVLLENILKAQSKGSPIVAVYPEDGVIPIPSPIAILADTRQPELAKKAYDWFFSADAQIALTHSGLYSALPRIAPPAGALSWAALSPQLMKWNPEILAELFAKREALKSRFSEVSLH